MSDTTVVEVNQPTIVTSKTDIRANAKAIATLVGGIITGLAAFYGPDSAIGGILPVLTIIATAVVTWATPNAQVVPTGTNPSGQAYEDGFDPDAATEDGEPYDYGDAQEAADAYQGKHVDPEAEEEPVTWADEAPQVEGDVEDGDEGAMPDTPLPIEYHDGGPRA